MRLTITSAWSRMRSRDGVAVGSYSLADLNEAAGAADAYACS